ncbi:beta-ribofuranosylaminobenzene 5'-phosphate synthase family protein [Micromonospora okii]|uniref:beta-ribofuranosylaminobenzene 5'-phosphate synthase family protein n=1 Tax=Micromonospora okii TaxID=1182970 RepID=UPI001E4130E2|nr:beta-ribofuranosylaminobenzene 5'-phosphate synthase family protein [Micromonospora okii]
MTGHTVQVSGPARLSFTLINLDAASLRRNGIAAMAVRRPGLTVRVRPSDDGTSRVLGVEPETTADLAAALATLEKLWEGPPATVTVSRPLPQHCGFGSKTVSLLAVGRAYGALCGQEPALPQLSELLGRGRTSGASTGLAEFGGFLVDGGHRNPADFAASPATYLRPSRFAQPVPVPKPVVRLPFPPWPVLVLMTNGRHLGGAEELAWFQRVTPIPQEQAQRTAQLVFMGLAPAVAERDYDAFCDAVNEITFTGHFKREQIAFQGRAVEDVLTAGRASTAIDAIALSVTGPACFAFTRAPEAAREWAQSLVRRGLLRDFWFTNADNRGLTLDYVP